MSYCDHLLSVVQCGPSVVRPSSIVRLATPLNDFSSVTPRSIFFKFHVEPCVKGGLKIVQMVMVHYSRWPPCLYMVKALKNLLLQNQESFKAES